MPARLTPQTCPVKWTVDVISGKWKTVILNALKSGPQRTGVLLRHVPGISKKMLTGQLRELERDGIVNRVTHGQKPIAVQYSLTATGETLRPILESMAAWGAKHRRGNRLSA